MSVAEEPPGAVVSTALQVYRERWRPLTACGLIAAVPVAALDAVIALQRGSDPFAVRPASTPAQPALDVTLLPSVLSLILYAVVSAACVHIVARARDGRDVGWSQALGLGLRSAAGVVVASIVVFAAVALGLVALVLPGIWIAVALSLTTPALVLERLAPLAALRRSYALVRGRWWRTAGVMAFGVLLAIALVLVILIPASALGASVEGLGARVLIATLADIVATSILVPLMTSVMTVLYLERRGTVSAAAPRGDEPGEGDDASYRGFAPPVPPDPAPSRFEPPSSPPGDAPSPPPPAASGEPPPPPERPGAG